MKEEDKEEDLIIVCSFCQQASCWQGIFICEKYRNAETTQKTREELRKLALESPNYWKTDEELASK